MNSISWEGKLWVKSTNPATYPFWRLFVCFVPKVILFHGCREMFLITAAQINQFRNEGLKGCNKSFTTFYFFFSASQLVCAIFFSFPELFFVFPACVWKAIMWNEISSGLKIYFIVALLLGFLSFSLLFANSHMRWINQFRFLLMFFGVGWRHRERIYLCFMFGFLN